MAVRSISLPSRVHPASDNLEAALNHMKYSCLDTSRPFGAEAIQHGLVGLADVYNCVQELLGSSRNQSTLRSLEGKDRIQELLDESVILLDTCDTARNLVSKMKEHLQAIQSALRRRRGDDAIVEAEVAAYIGFRRKAKRDLKKSLLQMKRLETKFGQAVAVFGVDQNVSAMIKVLRGASMISVSFFKSLLMFVSVPSSMKGRSGGFSSIAKTIRVTLLTSPEKGKKVVNEIESVDLALCNLKNKVEVQMVQKMSEALSVNLHEIEGGLDSIFLSLVQSRVLLLNIITPL